MLQLVLIMITKSMTHRKFGIKNFLNYREQNYINFHYSLRLLQII